MLVEYDHRRQLGQRPRLVFGHIPANHYGQNTPLSDSLSDLSGDVSDLATLAVNYSSVGANANSDTDGVLNYLDAFPNDGSRFFDIDGDRINDEADADRYDAGYVIKHVHGSDVENGISHQLLQGNFSASTRSKEVGANRGVTNANWRFIDADSELRLRLVSSGRNNTGNRSFIAEIRRPGETTFTRFGSRTVRPHVPIRVNVD